MLKKAQSASEYLIVIGFIVAVIIPIILYLYSSSLESSRELSSVQVNDILSLIIEKAESAYYLGAPTKHTIEANFPSGIESININTHEIVFNMRKSGGISEIHKSTKVPLQGSLRPNPGIHKISIESKENFVLISD